MSRSVLICSDYLPPSDGGVETVVERLARGLAENGWTVHLFTLASDAEAVDVADGIHVRTVGSVDTTELLGLQSKVSLSAPKALADYVDEVRPDLIHVHNRFFFTSFSVLLWKLLMGRDVPVVTTLHLGELGNVDGAGGVAARAYERTVGRMLLARSDHVIAVSEAVANISAGLGADPDATTVIRNSVDVDEYAPGDERQSRSLLFVGRLVRNNGPHVFLDAVADVVDAYPDLDVHVVGSGPMRKRLEDRVAQSGLESRVTIHGFVDDVVSYFQRATVFCRPSFSEGLPLTLLEAMSTATPPVVTDIAGVPEVVTDGRTGMLVPPGDSTSVADAITELLADDDRRNAMGSTAREYVVENHSWERRTQKVIDVYDDLLKRRRVSETATRY